ncbi:MAG: NAD(P)-dependent oxidoreductase, partial [Candidatus Rokuibacteriota bacterium]
MLPRVDEGMRAAIAEGGGDVCEQPAADAIVWTDARDPEGLRRALEGSTVTWVQLPFAGIEKFVAAGVIDPARTWTCAKGIYGHSTGEHALALMLAAARCLHTHLRSRTWDGVQGLGRSERQLKDARVVVVGAGGIARDLALMLRPLQARVTVVSRSGREVEGAQGAAGTEQLPELLPGADFLVVAAALTEETRGMIGADALASLNEGAWLVNVARGGLVDT